MPSAEKDVDGFSPVNVGRMQTGQPCFLPCTPAGCIRMIRSTGTKIDGKNAVVIGRSNIVGKPAALLLLAKNATVTVCHSHTANLKEICANADILVAAVGRAGFVTGDMVKPGAVVIDVGINRGADGKLHGDVNFEEASAVASYSPGARRRWPHDPCHADEERHPRLLPCKMALLFEIISKSILTEPGACGMIIKPHGMGSASVCICTPPRIQRDLLKEVITCTQLF